MNWKKIGHFCGQKIRIFNSISERNAQIEVCYLNDILFFCFVEYGQLSF